MVSIIIALFNGSHYISKTIESVINQEYNDIELIIIDDCSTDNSVEIVSNWKSKDPRISLYVNKENMGFCKTANVGVGYCKGELVLVLGQDDLLCPDHISKMVLSFNQTECAVVYCDYYGINKFGEIVDLSSHCLQRELRIMDFLKYNAMPSCGALIQKKYFDAVKGYPVFDEFPQYGEWYLWIKLAECGRIIFCNDVHALYRKHENNLTSTFSDNKVQIKLEKYWNICRCRLLKSKNISYVEKIKVILYVFLAKCKSVTKIVIRR